VRSPGFGPGFLPWQGNEQTIDWKNFETFMLKEYRPLAMARCKYKYARQFAHCLFGGNLSELRLLTDDKRCHVLKSLSALAKFIGVHTEFKGMVKNFGLKWGGKNPDDIIIARLTKPENSDEMYKWMRAVKTRFPAFETFVDFMAATGLRYVEAVNSWNLIVELAKQGKLGNYYEDNKQVLEHYRFKEIFIRRSKKAYISFVSRELIQKIAQSDRLKMNALTCRVRKKGMKQRFGDIREFQGSLLTRTHTQPEIDFLHGRVSTGVFMTNYFNPAWISDLQSRTLKAAAGILAKIS
jgi:hypothetical protein